MIVGAGIGGAFPYLELQLEQAGIKLQKTEYTTMMIFVSGLYFIFFVSIGAILFTKLAPDNSLLLAVTVATILSFLIFIQISLYPHVLIKKKIRDIESNLVFALRTMLVQIQSGVSLFTAMNLIAIGNFGILSQEFKRMVDEISTGTSEEVAMQTLATKNPSVFLRKALWQIIGGLKAGADVNDVLSETVSSMIKQQSLEINKYGSKLRLLSLAYMMIGVIFPALGITFLIVLGGFPSLKLSENLFWIMLAGIIIFEFMFMGMMKAQRPNLLSG